MGRKGVIVISLVLVASLHIYSTTGAEAGRSRNGKIRQPDESSSVGTCLADIDSCRPGERITVQGTVGDLWEPASKRAPHTVILRDQSGSLEIVHWLADPPGIAIGNSVECTGTVEIYRGQLQLRLWSKNDLHLIGCAGKPSMGE